jgi:hypothetical protein
MGGLGSGRPGRRATVEGTGALELDAAAVVRPALEALRRAAPGFAIPEGRWLDLPEGRVAWSRDGEPWAAAEVGLRLGPDWGVARLRYDIEHLTCATGPQNQTVALTTTPCRFGGLRWWWRCPETDGAAPSSSCPTAAGGSSAVAPTAWPTPRNRRTRSCARTAAPRACTAGSAATSGWPARRRRPGPRGCAA